ncbi:Glu-tRNA(Gln) amidotransferase subunit GatD [Candidatus Altiarchaeota archaeon]
MDENLKPGKRIKVEHKEGTHEGIVMERSSLAKPTHIVLKLDSGYNVGIEKKNIKKATVIKKTQKGDAKAPTLSPKVDSNLPPVSVLATGGTIASRVDYITGGVVSATTAKELVAAVPELGGIATLSCGQIFNKFSENMAPKDWIAIAQNAFDVLKKEKPQGIVITHGTDTMGYSSAALSFLLQTPVPIVFTGAQRSSDRGSSDAALNMVGAVRFAAEADFSGVCVAMHGSSDDSNTLIHPGARVRKLHTSRRDAFKTVGDSPIATIEGKNISLLNPEKNKRGGKLELCDKLEEKVFLLKYAPGTNPEFIEKLVDGSVKGIVLEGTGLGHVSDSLFEPLKNAISSGVHVVMTSQTIWGRVNMNVYSTGRNLLEMGVIPGEDMLSETAYVKLMWVLAREKKQEKVKELMLTNIVGEITKGTPIEEDIPDQ